MNLKNIVSAIDELPWIIIIFLCLTLGLAPFSPPHIIEKLSMLAKGSLIKPVDWFDLLFHGFPWMLLLLKSAAFFIRKNKK